jgi:hypothetical protein
LLELVVTAHHPQYLELQPSTQGVGVVVYMELLELGAQVDLVAVRLVELQLVLVILEP